MKNGKKAKAIVLIEKLRLIESEIFRIGSKYGVKTANDLDKLLAKGKLSEEMVGDNLFLFDHLISEKDQIEKELTRLGIKKTGVWKSLQHLLELPKLNFRT